MARNIPQTLSLFASVLALCVPADAQPADPGREPVIVNQSPEAVEAEMADMLIVAARKKADQTPPIVTQISTEMVAPAPAASLFTPPAQASSAPIVETNPAPVELPTPARASAIAPAAAESTVRTSALLGDTVAQLLPALKRKAASLPGEPPSIDDVQMDQVAQHQMAEMRSFAVSRGNISLPAREASPVRTDPKIDMGMSQSQIQGNAAQFVPTATEYNVSAQVVDQPRTRVTLAPSKAAAGTQTATDWRAAGQPSAEHELLDIFQGTWNVNGSFDMGPGQPPELADGVMTTDWQLESRWCRQRYEGHMPSLGSFSGLGYMGFDKSRGKFISTWMDTLSTGVVSSEGTFDASSATFTLSGKVSMPGVGEVIQRQAIQVVSPDKYTVTLWVVTPDGRETRTGQIDYTRASSIKTYTNVPTP